MKLIVNAKYNLESWLNTTLIIFMTTFFFLIDYVNVHFNLYCVHDRPLFLVNELDSSENKALESKRGLHKYNKLGRL